MKNVTITLLNDGETFTSTEGTSVCLLSEDDVDLLASGERTIGELVGAVGRRRYDLTNPVHLRMLADRIEKSR
jgi:hypothetical protein